MTLFFISWLIVRQSCFLATEEIRFNMQPHNIALHRSSIHSKLAPIAAPFCKEFKGSVHNSNPLHHRSSIHSIAATFYKEFKGVVHNSNPLQFWSNSVNCSSTFSSCPFRACLQNALVFNTQSWLCEWETNPAARTEPWTLLANQHVALGA